jgi:hypothetical protein
MTKSDAPALAGIHRLKLPVRNLARSRERYHSRVGYNVEMEFVEKGRCALGQNRGPHRGAVAAITSVSGSRVAGSFCNRAGMKMAPDRLR